MIGPVAGGIVEVIRANAALLDALPDGILVADGDGRIAFCNTQLETLAGYSSGELVGQPVETLVSERLRSAHVQHRGGYVAA